MLLFDNITNFFRYPPFSSKGDHGHDQGDQSLIITVMMLIDIMRLAMWKSFDPVIVQCCSITFIISFLTIQCHHYSDYGHNHRDEGPDHQDNAMVIKLSIVILELTIIIMMTVILLLLTYDTIMLLHLKCHYIFVSLWRLSL